MKRVFIKNLMGAWKPSGFSPGRKSDSADFSLLCPCIDSVSFSLYNINCSESLIMYLTQKNQIRELNKSEFVAVRELCRLSKNLYNVGLYTVRQYFFQERKHLRYESAYHLCKTNENYKFLNTD